MNDINPIYYNQFGVAFRWKAIHNKEIKKVQLVFRATGLLLSMEELYEFSKKILYTKENSPMCKDCTQDETCKALLVDSPAPQVTFAFNAKELQAVQDLVEGTLFQLNLDNYLGKVCNY